MKLLMIYCTNFNYTPTIKVLETVQEQTDTQQFDNAQVAFIQAELEDMEKASDVEKKLLKNLKWICSKNEVKKIILHSFAHLSESKAEPDFTKTIFDNVEQRLKNSGFEVYQTPFGYFLDLQINAPGFSLARVFKDI
jgi:hypothetical protein